MSREFHVIIDFVAAVPSLPGCHTQAKSLDELMERIREAIKLCLEVEQDTGESLEFVGFQRVTAMANPYFSLVLGLSFQQIFGKL